MSANNFPIEVRSRIRKIRQLRDYSQEYMGEQLGITQKGYSAIELGETTLTLERLDEIARVLEVTINELMSFDEKVLFNNQQNSGNLYNTLYGNITNGELYEKMLKQFETENIFLKKQIEKLHKIIDKLGGQ